MFDARTEIVTYHGPAGGGLEDDKEYVVRVIAEDRAEDLVFLSSQQSCRNFKDYTDYTVICTPATLTTHMMC